jgi:hypothetical protein
MQCAKYLFSTTYHMENGQCFCLWYQYRRNWVFRVIFIPTAQWILVSNSSYKCATENSIAEADMDRVWWTLDSRLHRIFDVQVLRQRLGGTRDWLTRKERKRKERKSSCGSANPDWQHYLKQSFLIRCISSPLIKWK